MNKVAEGEGKTRCVAPDYEKLYQEAMQANMKFAEENAALREHTRQLKQENAVLQAQMSVVRMIFGKEG